MTGNILITGASGFIGSFIVEEALKRGFSVWAAVRKSSPRRYLQDSRINFIELDLSDESKLTEQLSGHRFGYIVHAAGVTKCSKPQDFFNVNTAGTIHLVNAVKAAGCLLRRFVFVSSLSVIGSVREERPYLELTNADTPRPQTLYGQSKLKAEEFLRSEKGFPWIALRLTGVYGPREKDYFLMFKSIKNHVDFAAGRKPQAITFVYVSDVVEAVFLALEHGQEHESYIISDGETYSSRTFSDFIRQELHVKTLLRLNAPLWLLRLMTTAGQCWGRLTGHMPTLNNDKYHILSQRNWRCDITPARRDLGFSPKVKLAEGVCLTARWYKDEGWL